MCISVCTFGSVVVLLALLLLVILAVGWTRKISHLIVFKGEPQGEFLLGFNCEIKSTWSSQPEQYHILSLKQLKSNIFFFFFVPGVLKDSETL